MKNKIIIISVLLLLFFNNTKGQEYLSVIGDNTLRKSVCYITTDTLELSSILTRNIKQDFPLPIKILDDSYIYIETELIRVYVVRGVSKRKKNGDYVFTADTPFRGDKKCIIKKDAVKNDTP